MSSKTWRSFHDLEVFFQYTANQKYFIAINIVHRTVTSVCYLPLLASDIPQFSCAFANLRIATVSSVMSVCLSIFSHWTIRFTLDEFLWDFTFHCFSHEALNDLYSSNVSGFFIDIKSFRLHYGPGVDSASSRRVPGAFPRGKGGRCVRLTTYHYPVPVSRDLGALTSWNPLGSSGPVTGLLYLYLC